MTGYKGYKDIKITFFIKISANSRSILPDDLNLVDKVTPFISHNTPFAK